MASAKGARTAAMWGADRLAQGQEQTLAELGTGYGNAAAGYNQADAFYHPYVQRSEQGAGMYANALGLNGAGGNATAQGAFQAGPGYQFNMDQGLQALMRKRAAGGMLNSGNADADTLKFSQGLAGQEWNGWLDRLGGLGSQGASIAGQRGANAIGLGNLGYGYAKDRVGIMDTNLRDTIGLGVGALKAGDQAKTTNQNMMLAGAQTGLSMLGSAMTGGLTGFTNFSKTGQSVPPSNY